MQYSRLWHGTKLATPLFARYALDIALVTTCQNEFYKEEKKKTWTQKLENAKKRQFYELYIR